MHRWHGGELVDKLAAHPYALGVVMSDCVEKAILFRQKSWRHTGVDDKSEEGAEVGKGQSAAGDGESVEGRSDVVVPTDEAAHVSQGVTRLSKPVLTQQCPGYV